MSPISSIWTWLVEHPDKPLVILAIADFLVGIIGFTLAIVELRRTKKAVDASKEATEHTLQAMSDRLTISDISLIQGSLREIQVALRGERWESALIRAQEASSRFHELKARQGFSDDFRRTKIQQMVTRLAKLQGRLERTVADSTSFSVPNANQMLGEFAATLSEWREEVRFFRRSENR